MRLSILCVRDYLSIFYIGVFLGSSVLDIPFSGRLVCLRKPEVYSTLIHIIHIFKKFFGGILWLSPCCLHLVHIMFPDVHTYILELITLFKQFSPQNIEFCLSIHKVIHIIHIFIHIIYQGSIQELSTFLSTFSPDSKLYFFLRVCYSILRTQDDNR